MFSKPVVTTATTLFALLALLSLSTPARALSVLYTYTGEPYTSVSGAYTTSMFVSGSFTVELPDPFTNLPSADRTAQVIAFSFHDGLRTITDADTLESAQFTFSTEENGDLFSWEIVLALSDFDRIAVTDSAGNFAPNAYSAASLSLSEFALNDVSPGSWETTVVPEPSSLGLVSVVGGLALLLRAGRVPRRRA